MSNNTIFHERTEILKWFIWAIYKKIVLKVTFDSLKGGVLVRKCIPFDFGPSNRSKDKTKRYYHVFDLDGGHIIPIPSEQIIEIEMLEEEFDPKDFVHWTPKWHVQRDWGMYS